MKRLACCLELNSNRAAIKLLNTIVVHDIGAAKTDALPRTMFEYIVAAELPIRALPKRSQHNPKTYRKFVTKSVKEQQ